MPVKTLLTLDDLETMPDDAMHRELLHGALIEMPPARSDHSDLAYRIHASLAPFVAAHRLGRVYIEAGYKLFEDKQTWLQPDVSWVSAARLAAPRVNGYFFGAPDLAIEIVSPSDLATDLDRKVKAYFSAGAEAVWIVYPDTRNIHLFEFGGKGSQIRTTGAILTAPDLFPGWEAPVIEFFED